MAEGRDRTDRSRRSRSIDSRSSSPHKSLVGDFSAPASKTKHQSLPIVVNSRVSMANEIPLAIRTIEATVFSPLRLTRQVPLAQGPPVTLSCPAWVRKF